MKKNLLLLGAFLFSLSTNAQLSSHKSCGHEVIQRQYFESQEAYEQAKESYKAEILPKFLKQGAAKSGIILDVPVVFHVIHDGEPIGTGKNISDGQIMAQLDVLNKDFSATNDNYNDTTRTSWDAVKDNPEINFCITTEDPSGNPHSGILRHQIAITGTDANNNNIEDVKDSIYWNTNNFVNIYVLSIPGTDANGGVVGYAFLPYFGTVGQSLDGIVVDYNWFGGPGYGQSGDRTLTHEMGHFLGLFHTFDGNSCSSDDGLSDTPNTNVATSSLNGTLNCGDPMNQYPTGPTSCTEEHMYVNYMDYINDDSCPTSFTSEQVAVLRGVLLGTAGGYASREDLVSNALVVCGGCELAATLTKSDPSCFEVADGSISVAVSGGTAPYTYLWSSIPAQDSSTAINLGGGSYAVTITDNEGCEVIIDTTLVNGTGVVFSTSTTDESIPGANDGTAEVFVSAGAAPYLYNWDQGLPSIAAQSNLSPGTYGLTVTDNNGCSAMDTVFINSAPCQDLIIDASTMNVTCEGGSDGQALLEVANGVTPFTYSWNGTNHPGDRMDLTAGTYTVDVTDSLGCTGQIIITIAEPQALIPIVSTTDLTSVGANDGSASISVTGGTPGFTYLWSNGSTSPTILNLAPGIYSATVTDTNNCTATDTGEVSDFDCSALNVEINGDQFACYGDTSTLNVSVIGSAPFSYSWNTGATTASIEIYAAGAYSVSVTDANGCIGESSFSVDSHPEELNISFVAFSESGIDQNDGRIELATTGGITPYTYSWSNGATTATAENLTPGDYFFTITDANGCYETGQATVNAFQCATLDVNLTAFGASCSYSSDGSVVVSGSSGRAPFSFNWSSGDSTQAVQNLPSGNYSVTVTDANACIGTAEIFVSSPPEILVDFQITHETTEMSNDGSVVTSITGGTPPYNFNWSDGSTDANRMDLVPGEYILTTTDTLGCARHDTITILEFNCEEINIDPVIQNVYCLGESSGAIDLNIQSINGPYSVLWSNGWSGDVITGLAAGFYDVTITDNLNCVLVQNFSIIEPPILVLDYQVVNESAFAANDGNIQTMITGGTPPYAYQWSNGLSSADISDLSPGIYVVTATDDNGCANIDSIQVEAYVCPPFDIDSVYISDNICFGDANGAIDLLLSGGTFPYQFQWSNGAAVQNLDLLVAGTYEVTITDSKQCVLTSSFTIQEPNELTIVPSVSPVSAVGADDGSIDIAASGGMPPYSYNWSNGAQSSFIENLSEGTYALTVTDANNCTQTTNVIVEQYVCPQLRVVFEIRPITCSGLSNGELRAIPNSGIAPYAYSWSNGLTTDLITDLSAGTYFVEIRDSKGCLVVDTISLVNPDPLDYTTQVSNESANGANDGSISLNIQGGVEPYAVIWSDSIEGMERSLLTPGIYDFVIQDNNGCNIPGSVSVLAYSCPDLGLEMDVIDNLCADGDVGGVEIYLNNGIAPFEYMLNGEELPSSPSIRGLLAGTYSIAVVDSKNCRDTASFMISTPEGMVVTNLVTEDAVGNDPGAASIEVQGGTVPYTYEWSDGRTLFENANLYAGIHTVTVTDGQGCELVQEVTIYQENDFDQIQDLELFQAHPNPAEEVVNIQVEFESIRTIKVVITSIGGSPVFTETVDSEMYNKYIDVSPFPKGHYKITIYTKDEVISKSLVIL